MGQANRSASSWQGAHRAGTDAGVLGDGRGPGAGVLRRGVDPGGEGPSRWPQEQSLISLMLGTTLCLGGRRKRGLVVSQPARVADRPADGPQPRTRPRGGLRYDQASRPSGACRPLCPGCPPASGAGLSGEGSWGKVCGAHRWRAASCCCASSGPVDLEAAGLAPADSSTRCSSAWSDARSISKVPAPRSVAAW